MNPMDMSDREFALYQARRNAADAEQRDGNSELGELIGAGKADDYWRVRLELFFLSPTEHDHEYYDEWDRLAKKAA